MKINNYYLPLFNNGSFSGAAIAIPVNFTSSSYNSVDIMLVLKVMLYYLETHRVMVVEQA